MAVRCSKIKDLPGLDLFQLDTFPERKSKSDDAVLSQKRLLVTRNPAEDLRLSSQFLNQVVHVEIYRPSG